MSKPQSSHSPRELESGSEDGYGTNEDGEGAEELAEVPSIELEGDIFGFTICALVRDFHFLAKHKGSPVNRYVRIALTLFLLFGCIFTQVFLLWKFKEFVTAKAVHDIRHAYDLFEKSMYDETELTVNGNHRGVGYFNVTRFGDLGDHEQSSVCRIPLSQPEFFFAILCIWTLTCLQQLKRVQQDFMSLILNTKHCSSMKDSQQDIDGAAGSEILISHLTYGVKALIFCIVLIPRAVITSYLLWIGCRWLLATNNFADLILNAVALEFVLLMKDSLYIVLVSERNKRDMANTKINPPVHQEKAGIWVFTGTIFWLLLAFAWVLLYMGIPHRTDGVQAVLPEYRWDVQHVCTRWIKWRYCVEPPCPHYASVEEM